MDKVHIYVQITDCVNLFQLYILCEAVDSSICIFDNGIKGIYARCYRCAGFTKCFMGRASMKHDIFIYSNADSVYVPAAYQFV